MARDASVHVLVEALDEPRVEDAEPRSRFYPIDGGEDGEKAVVKWLAASPFLRQARCGDGAVGVWERLECDGEVQYLFAQRPCLFWKGFEFDGFDRVYACARLVICSLCLLVQLVPSWCGVWSRAEVFEVLLVFVLEVFE